MTDIEELRAAVDHLRARLDARSAELDRVRSLIPATAKIIATLREAFRNDGAEGESVHALCDLHESLQVSYQALFTQAIRAQSDQDSYRPANAPAVSNAALKVTPVTPIGKIKKRGFGHLTDGGSVYEWEVDDYPHSPEGVRLCELRRSLGIGLRDAARRMGISALELSGLELGSHTCDWPAAYAILQVDDG